MHYSRAALVMQAEARADEAVPEMKGLEVGPDEVAAEWNRVYWTWLNIYQKRYGYATTVALEGELT